MNVTVGGGGGWRPLLSSALGHWRREGVYSIHLQDEESVCASILSRSGPEGFIYHASAIERGAESLALASGLNPAMITKF